MTPGDLRKVVRGRSVQYHLTEQVCYFEKKKTQPTITLSTTKDFGLKTCIFALLRRITGTSMHKSPQITLLHEPVTNKHSLHLQIMFFFVLQAAKITIARLWNVLILCETKKFLDYGSGEDG